MVLASTDFRLHPSLRKTMKKFIRSADCEVRVDTAFEAVIQSCASVRRHGQDGTWIVPEMIEAYTQFHQAGFAHSVEIWIRNELVGGLYFIAMGQAVFGESMFHRTTDASKIALVALVCLCRQFNVGQIDCQQNTRHLALLGAKEVRRKDFLQNVDNSIAQPAPEWHFSSRFWNQIANLHAELS